MEVFKIKDINKIKDTIKENFPLSERSYPLIKDTNKIISELIKRIDSSMGGILAVRDVDNILGAL